MKENYVYKCPSRIRTRVSPLLVGRDIHYTIGSTTLDTWPTYLRVWIERSQSTGHFSKNLCVSWLDPKLNFGLSDRQKFSKAKRALETLKDVNKLQMAFDTRFSNEKKIACPEQDSDP